MKSLTKKQIQIRNDIAQSRQELQAATARYNKVIGACTHKYVKRGINAFCIICSTYAQSLYCEGSPTKLCHPRWNGSELCEYCRNTLEDKFEDMQASYNHVDEDIL